MFKYLFFISVIIFNVIFSKLYAAPAFDFQFKRYVGKISYYFTNQPLIYGKYIIYAGQGDKPKDDKFDKLYVFDYKGNLKWSYPSTKSTEKIGNVEGVVVSNNTVYFSSDKGYIYATTLTGSLKWRFKTKGKIKSFTTGDINGDKRDELLAGSWDHYLYALSQTGHLLWKSDLMDVVDSSPVIFEKDNKKYIAAGSNVGGLFILNNKGKVVDFFQAKDSVKSSPVIFYGKDHKDFRLIFGSDDGNLYILNKDFKRINKFKINDRILSSPSLADIDGDNTPEIFISCDNKEFYGLTITDKIIVNKKHTTGIMASPVILKYKNSFLILLADLDGFVKLITLNGKELWSFKTGDMIFSTPAIGDPDKDGKPDLVVPSGDGYLYFFEATTTGIVPIWARWHGDAAGSGDYEKAVSFGKDLIRNKTVKEKKEEVSKIPKKQEEEKKSQSFFQKTIRFFKGMFR